MTCNPSVGDVLVEPGPPRHPTHYLIIMEWAEHPGETAFEVVRMIPACPPRYIYERWKITKLSHRAKLPTYAARHIHGLARRVWAQVRDRYAGTVRPQRIYYATETVELVAPGQWWTESNREYVSVLESNGKRLSELEKGEWTDG